MMCSNAGVLQCFSNHGSNASGSSSGQRKLSVFRNSASWHTYANIGVPWENCLIFASGGGEWCSVSNLSPTDACRKN